MIFILLLFLIDSRINYAGEYQSKVACELAFTSIKHDFAQWRNAPETTYPGHICVAKEEK